MSDRFDHPASSRRVRTALEANCDALLAMELACASAGSGGPADDIAAHTRGAIEALRRAIVELRLAVQDGSGATEFVLPASGAPATHATPRRTA